MILANLVWMFHILVILVVLVLPFTNIPALLLLHFVFGTSLLVHWYFNSDICSLTLIESKLRGIKISDSFSHKLISPLYTISKTDWSNVCYIIVIVLSSISLYKFLKSDALKKSKECFKKNRKLQCFLPLFKL